MRSLAFVLVFCFLPHYAAAGISASLRKGLTLAKSRHRLRGFGLGPFGQFSTLKKRSKDWLDPVAGHPAPKRGWRTGGGVVLDFDSGKILLVRNHKEKRTRNTNGWTLPKGKDDGAGPAKTARQEVLEEGGVVARGLIYLGALPEKSLGRKRLVHRHYYLMQKVLSTGEWDHETAEVGWFTPKQARKLLQQSRDRSVLKQAKRALHKLERIGAGLKP